METSDHDYLLASEGELTKAMCDEMLYGRGVVAVDSGKVRYIPLGELLKARHLSTSAEEEIDG